MPKFVKIISLLAAIIIMASLCHSVRADETQKAAPGIYRLDDTLGTSFAFYPGGAIRSNVTKDVMVSSLADLEQRVSKLPAGTQIMWSPYKRDSSLKPILFSQDVAFEQFEHFCREHNIQLVMSSPQCTHDDECNLYCEDKAENTGDCKSAPPPICHKNQCACYAMCL